MYAGLSSITERTANLGTVDLEGRLGMLLSLIALWIARNGSLSMV